MIQFLRLVMVLATLWGAGWLAERLGKHLPEERYVVAACDLVALACRVGVVMITALVAITWAFRLVGLLPPAPGRG